ncbi:MAG: aryl-sulfate sulfotransferase [Chitinophagaceae bacterium]
MPRFFILVAVLISTAIGCRKPDNPHQPPINPPLLISIDSVIINPSGYAPLTALVLFSSTVNGKTFIKIQGKHGPDTDVEHVFNDYGLHHAVQVIGLYSEYLNTVNIRLISNKGDTVAKTTLNIRIGALPPNLPTSIIADVFQPGQVEKGLLLVSNLSTVNPQIPLMLDNYGEVRWLLNYSTHKELNRLAYNNGLKRLRNGNFYFGDVRSKKIYEIDLVGTVMHTWDLSKTGYEFHHEVDEKPDGNLIVSVTKTGSKNFEGIETIEDYIIEINRRTGAISTVWDLKESLDEFRFSLIETPDDWIHVNAVLYDSTDNTIIVSGRHQGVIKLTFENKIKWILATHKGWTRNRRGEELDRFLLTPLAYDGSRITDTAVLNGTKNHPDFEWTWYQHSSIALPDGNFMFFDNGDSRNYDPALPKYSRAVEYRINAKDMTIQQVWQYGKDRGLETFAPIVSSVQFMPGSNHVLFCPGNRVKNEQGFGGKIIELDYVTKKVVLQLSISAVIRAGFHKAKRISVYPE